MVDRKRGQLICGAAIAGVAAMNAGLIFKQTVADGAVVANYSTTVETSGAFGTSSFQAAGNAAPNDAFPAYGAVAFPASGFSSLATSGVSSSATLTLTEYNSTSGTSTRTSAGSTVNIYFAEAPVTTNAGLAAYDTTNEPGGFDATNYNADLVGTATYTQTANGVDTVAVTLSAADVTYIDNTLSAGTTGTFEFFTAAQNASSSARYDGVETGTFATEAAALTLTAAAAATPEPASVLLAALGAAPVLLRRRRTSRSAAK